MTPPAAVATAHAPTARRRAAAPSAAPSRGPRRVSGPARRPVAVPLPRPGALRLLDRVFVGRAWIFFVAGALMGLVFLQVSLLKLNAGIGRAVTAESTFERQNAQLRSDVAKLESGDRIEAVAAKLGLVMPGADRVRYVTVTKADGMRAARSVTAPAPVAQQLAAAVPGTAAQPTATPEPAAAVPGTAAQPTATPEPAAAVPGTAAQPHPQSAVTPQTATPEQQAATTAAATGGVNIP